MAEKRGITRKKVIIAAVVAVVFVGAFLITLPVLYLLLGSEGLKSAGVGLAVMGVMVLMLGITVLAIGMGMKLLRGRKRG